MKIKFEFEKKEEMLLSEPVIKLSIQITRAPSDNNFSQRLEPIKPAPPATKYVGINWK